MSTSGLALLVALIGGLELAVRGHLGDRPGWLHAGVWLLIALSLAAGWVARRRGSAWAAGAAATLAGSLGALSILELGLARWSDAEATLPPIERAVGLRAPEPLADVAGSAPDAGRFRIFTLGGSASFARTDRSDPSWPARLERRIREALVCAVPVEVLDAGRPGDDLPRSIATLESEVLPRTPELLLIQVGAPDLARLAQELDVPDVGPAPRVPNRASRIGRALETALRSRAHARRWEAARRFDVEASALAETRSLALYRRLLVQARSRAIEVRLLSAVLAVNERSGEDRLRRHEAAFPGTRRAVLANVFHGRLLHAVAARTGSRALDTREALGAVSDEAFVDLVHLSALGRERLAERVLAGLRDLLGRPRPGCRERLARRTGRGGQEAGPSSTRTSTSARQAWSVSRSTARRRSARSA